MSDDAVWASFATGKSIGDHGRYHGPHQYGFNSYYPVKFCDKPMDLDPFWSRLGRQGYDVAVIDVPKCPLAKKMRGFQISDWLVHGRDHAQPISQPSVVAQEVVGRFGMALESLCTEYTFGRGAVYHRGFSQKDARQWVNNLIQSADMKFKASQFFLRQQNWDCFITVFKELHCAGHLYWD